MAVKGYTPPPDPQDFSSKFQLRSAQRAHEKFAKQAEEGRFVAKDKPDYQSASRHRNGEGNPLLQAAAVRRNSIAYGDNSYTNPMDFVRDMWADGFISTEQAVPLVKEFEALGKPGQLMDAFLVQQHRLGHVTGRNRDDKRFILGVTGDRSHHVADELTQMRTYTDVERSPSEEAARTDDNRTDEARLRNQVLKSIAQRTDDPNVAFAVALEAVMETRETPAERSQRDLQRWDHVAAAVEESAKSKDLGELTAVKTNSFADREAARVAARSEDKSQQR